MATNQLMEAAAEILAGSKSKATAMPPQKLEGGVVDLGGPTPQNSKPDDDSNKIHTTKAAKSATAPTTKPSDASSAMPSTNLRKEEEETDEDQELIDSEEEFQNSIKEDVDAIFGDDSTISEDFRSKVSTIFEARVNDRVLQIQEQLEVDYASMLEEAVETIKTELTEKVDDYLNYVVEQWLKENELAIESGLRAELSEEFIAGLRNLFAEHYIDVPAEKVDLVDELAGKVEELEGKLNEEIERAVEYKKALVESVKSQITYEVCDGLTATQVEKIKSLAESVEFSTEEEYAEKLETIRENYFPSGVKKADAEQLHEQVEDTEDANKNINDPFVAAVSKAISKTKI
jgi:hypothetical protein